MGPDDTRSVGGDEDSSLSCFRLPFRQMPLPLERRSLPVARWSLHIRVRPVSDYLGNPDIR